MQFTLVVMSISYLRKWVIVGDGERETNSTIQLSLVRPDTGGQGTRGSFL